MQRFGRAGRDFSLQAIGILLAEPRWFLEDHQKRLARRMKQGWSGRKKALRPRTDPGARVSNIGCSDNKSGSEEEIGVNAGDKNKNIPPGDREGASDVEEAIKSIPITAGGRGCK